MCPAIFWAMKTSWLSLIASAIILSSITTEVFSADPVNKAIAGVWNLTEIKKLHTGFKFTEGPAVDAEGSVYFADIPNDRIHKTDTSGKLTTFLENSKKCNGLMIDSAGKIIACQGGEGRIIAIDSKTKAITGVATAYNNKPFNSPNDLVLSKEGGVFFTDPKFGEGETTQDKMAVYYVKAGTVTRLIDNLQRPNGVLLSPDESQLYVLPSGQPEVMVYPIVSPGVLGEARVFCKLEQADPAKPRGGDGLTVDYRGNLYLTAPGLKAIQVVSAEGKLLGLIYFPEAPSNCTFGGKDLRTLFVTAQTSLYTTQMELVGHRFSPPKLKPSVKGSLARR